MTKKLGFELGNLLLLATLAGLLFSKWTSDVAGTLFWGFLLLSYCHRRYRSHVSVNVSGDHRTTVAVDEGKRRATDA